MDATKTTKPKGDSQRQCANLDKRYGKIGISAVAAALLHQNGPRNETRAAPSPTGATRRAYVAVESSPARAPV